MLNLSVCIHSGPPVIRRSLTPNGSQTSGSIRGTAAYAYEISPSNVVFRALNTPVFVLNHSVGEPVASPGPIDTCENALPVNAVGIGSTSSIAPPDCAAAGRQGAMAAVIKRAATVVA